MADPRIISASAQEGDAQFEAGLRPRRLKDFTGQTKLKENLAIGIEAARQRGEAMDHILLYGPPGLGKTTLAAIIAEELEVPFEQTSGPVLHLNHYDEAELANIIYRSARILSVEIDEDGTREIARRSRGTPRIANRLLRRVRDYAQVRANGSVTQAIAQTALDLLEVDQFGLDEIDQKIMLTVLEKDGGGPVGLNTIAAAICEEPSTIEEVDEPYLIHVGFIDRTPRGRVSR